jgi:hypothetical protein
MHSAPNRRVTSEITPFEASADSFQTPRVMASGGIGHDL